MRNRIKDLSLPGLTDAGKQWLIAALDPFHDTPVRPSGLPDSDRSPSVVQTIKKSLTISAPAGTAGTWSFCVFTLPELQSMTMYPCIYKSGKYQPQYWNGSAFAADNPGGPGTVAPMSDVGLVNLSSDAAITLCTINVWCWNTDVTVFFPNGVDMWTAPNSTYFQGPQFGPAPVAEALPTFDSKSRVIGAGLELHNTTAELYKQGTLTVSRTSNGNRDGCMPLIRYEDGTALFTETGTSVLQKDYDLPLVKISNGPPATVSESMLYEGTRQWEAKEGVYSVLAMDALRNPMMYGTPAYRAFLNSLQASTTDADVKKRGFSLPANQYANFRKTCCQLGGAITQVAPHEITTIMASGLSAQTTFVLETIFYVEVSPHVNDPWFSSLVPLCRASPPEDLAALELYQRVSCSLPPGVPVAMNPAGEFWDMVRKVVTFVAPTVSNLLGLIPHPAAQIGSKVAALAARVAAVESKPPEKKAIAAPAKPAPKK